MITKIEINGFKSFRNFQMDFTPFTIVAGINASGKSNLFDALELLSRLAQYSLREAFIKNRGSAEELFSIIGNQECNLMEFAVEMLVRRTIKDNWGIEKEIKSPRLRYELHIERIHKTGGYEELKVTHESLELIKTQNDRWAKVFIPKEKIFIWKSTQHGGSKPFIQSKEINGVRSIYLRQDSGMGGKHSPANTINQTVLSAVNSNDFPHVFAAKMEMVNWKFMQLNPEVLREPTRKGPQMSDMITHNGGNLAAALFRIKNQDSEYTLTEISRELIRFLPEYVAVDVLNEEENRQFIIKLKNKEGEIFSSRVLSEGTLRLLSLIILQFDNEHKGLLCFEEPENGIHPMRIRQIADLLYNLSADYENENYSLRQVIVNTHSPILIKVLLQWSTNNNVSIWLSKMRTEVFSFNGRRVKMRATKMSIVSNSGEKDLFWKDCDPRSAAELAEYLSIVKDSNE